MDPLSDVLSLLKPSSTLSAGLRAGGDWAINFGPPAGIKFNALFEGNCWLRVDGVADAMDLRQGDCFLLTRPRAFTLASDLTLPAMGADAIYKDACSGIANVGGGTDFFLVGGRFSFTGQPAQILFDALPPVIHVRASSHEASVLHWTLQRLGAEMANPRPGGPLVSEHLAQIMLVEVLRLHLEDRTAPAGWLAALADKRLGPVMAAIHASPDRNWTVGDLAATAGMSRSSFAERFRVVVGVPPLTYLARWRMLLAGERLQAGRMSVAEIAFGLGYQSEGAFSTAFKKITSLSPRDYRRQAQG